MADGFFRSKKGFTVVQNEITRDRDISLKAKGLYLVIQANITMPDKKWRKEDFQAMTCEGKKAFDGAWNELKEAGYLKVHMYSKGTTWKVEYELLDAPADGAHTFYYNSQGKLTKTNIERAVTRAEKKTSESEVGQSEEDVFETADESEDYGDLSEQAQENLRIPPFGSNGEMEDIRYPHFGSNGNGYNGNGSNGDGINGNGGNNSNTLLTNPLDKTDSIKTSIQSYPQSDNAEDDGLMDETLAYQKIIKENISYDELMSWFDPEVRARFDELYQLICDVVCVPRKTVRVNGEEYPYQLVKGQFLKLKREHIEYVADCMKNNLGKVSNIRAYLITALYNAPSTYSNHVAQDYRTETQEAYVSEYDLQNKRELEEFRRLRDTDPEAYRARLRELQESRQGGVE